jgi:hypothetical protein
MPLSFAPCALALRLQREKQFSLEAQSQSTRRKGRQKGMFGCAKVLKNVNAE